MASQTIFTISLLPVDILSIITDYLEAQETTKLWISGDIFFKTRLEGGGITRLEYITNQLAIRPFKYRLTRWPKLISLCKQLQRLIISFGSNVLSSGLVLTYSDLQSLPKCLKHLEVQFELHECSFYRDRQVENAKHYGSLDSSLSSSLAPTLCNPWEKSHIFEQLESLSTLIIRGKSNISGMKAIKWPKHLLALSIDSEVVPGYTLLPEYLTSLDLPGCTLLDPHFFDSLPKSLISLSIPSLSPSSAVITRPLPSSLESLQIGVLDRFTTDLAGLLPHKLTKLSIACQNPIADSVLEWFPHHLKEVSLNGIIPCKLVSSKWPASITSMSCGVTHIPASIPFPSNLTSLVLTRANIQHSTILNLPPTLLVLIADAMDLTTNNASALPQHLTRLSIKKWQPPFDCLLVLPRKLTHLSSFPIDKESFERVLQTSLNTDSLSFFPPDLTYLHVVTVKTLPYPLLLPTQLETFVWNGPAHFAPTPLPSSLTELMLLQSLSDASSLPPLPPSLLRLVISSRDPRFHWGSHGFSLLPKSLRHLYAEGTVSHENMAHIPPHIIILVASLKDQDVHYCRDHFPDLFMADPLR